MKKLRVVFVCHASFHSFYIIFAIQVLGAAQYQGVICLIFVLFGFATPASHFRNIFACAKYYLTGVVLVESTKGAL